MKSYNLEISNIGNISTHNYVKDFVVKKERKGNLVIAKQLPGFLQ